MATMLARATRPSGAPAPPRSRRRTLLLAAATVAVLYAAVAPVLLYGDPLLHRIDLGVYRLGGSAVLHGQPLYDPSFGSALHPPLPFTYPPLAALLAAAMAPLPRLVNDVAWTVACIAVLVGVVALAFRPLLRRAGDRAPWVLLGVSMALLWTTPINDHLGFGQVNLFLMGLVLADLLVPHPRWPRGALIGLAAAIKLIPAVFVLYLVVNGQRRAARTAVLSALACTALAALALPGDSRTYWTGAFLDSGRVGSNAYFSNQSLHGIALRLLPGPVATPVWLAAALAVLVVGMRRARVAAAAGAPLAAAVLVGLTANLVSPVSWMHHLVWLVPALGLLVADGRNRRRVVVALGLLVLLWARLPYVGQHLVDHGAPALLSEPVRNAYGLVCLGLLLALPLPGSAARGAARRATRAAWTPAPYPLSTLTTTIPGAQEDSMVASAANPPAATP